MRTRPLVFVDAFAGCGGLSLGLLQAGLEGSFAIEKDKFAFATLKANLLERGGFNLRWPEWLPKEPTSIESLLRKFSSQLESLAGEVDVLVGGPPCQGFSSAGRRRKDDPRNRLFESYLKLVRLLRPKAVLIENVRGFTLDFRSTRNGRNYARDLREALAADYVVHECLLDLSQFGVPQMRTRYFLLALHPSVSCHDPFTELRDRLPGFLRSLGISAPLCSRAALSDLEVSRNGTQPSIESAGFHEIKYIGPLTRYQRLMQAEKISPPDLRLARHLDHIKDRFAQLIELSHAEGRLNLSINDEIRMRFGLRKRALRVLDPDRPAPTITSMPDDLLHYSEPRTLTVRENARLQGFPDWFSFKGKYTTGGHLRRREVPRFTQVANAVPPLVSRAFGELFLELLAEKSHHSPKAKSKERNSARRESSVRRSSRVLATPT